MLSIIVAEAPAMPTDSIAHRRVIRSTTFPPCPCTGIPAGAVPYITDIFLYTNGRCYCQVKMGPYSYSSAQTGCINTAGGPNVGRSATFDSGADYIAITSAMAGNTPGSGSNRAWIGLKNQQWDDPNFPACAPALNVSQFQTAAGVTIAPTGTIAVGGWGTWGAFSGSNLKSHLCEIGKHMCFEIHIAAK